MNKGGNRDTTRLLMERSVPGRVGAVIPPPDVPEQPLPDPAMLRSDLELPDAAFYWSGYWLISGALFGIMVLLILR